MFKHAQTYLCAGLMVLSLAATASPQADFVRVLKAQRKVQILSGDAVVREFPMVLGGNPLGHKSQEGDGKTPEGLYTLDYKKTDSAFHKAIHISYPNADDVAAAQKLGVSAGGQIMIHGQKNGLGWLSFIIQRFDWTNGCIALKNEDMDAFWQLVEAGTKIEIKP